MLIGVYENVKDWRVEGRLIYSGSLVIDSFHHDTDAKLFEAVLKSYLSASTDDHDTGGDKQ